MNKLLRNFIENAYYKALDPVNKNQSIFGYRKHEIEKFESEIRSQLLTEIEEMIEGMREEVELDHPGMIHIKSGGTDCCYCKVCGMDEMKIQDNKKPTKKHPNGEFFCNCSWWDDSYEGNWLRWKEGIDPKKEIDRFSPNIRNNTLDDLKAEITKLKYTKS